MHHKSIPLCFMFMFSVKPLECSLFLLFYSPSSSSSPCLQPLDAVPLPSPSMVARHRFSVVVVWTGLWGSSLLPFSSTPPSPLYPMPVTSSSLFFSHVALFLQSMPSRPPSFAQRLICHGRGGYTTADTRSAAETGSTVRNMSWYPTQEGVG